MTIKTVAEKAGVSIKTVSRVINKEPSVRSSTREKVQAIISELGYEPSPAAQALASNRSKIIGLIYDNPSAAYITDVQNGALQACYKNEYSLVIHPCQHESEELIDELVNLVQRSRLDGLLLTPPLSDNLPLINALIEKDIPLSCVAPEKPSSKYSSVNCNESEVCEEFTKYLIDSGHKDIGFILGHVDHGAAKKRFLGYHKAIKAANLVFSDSYVVQGDFSFNSGVEAAEILLGLENPPTAIFAANDYMAAGVLRVAKMKGIKVPDELAIVGFDDAPVSRQIWPMLSTIKQPVFQMSEMATNLLIAKVKDASKANEDYRLNAEMIIREST